MNSVLIQVCERQAILSFQMNCLLAELISHREFKVLQIKTQHSISIWHLMKTLVLSANTQMIISETNSFQIF